MSPSEPLFPRIGVVALPPESWSDHWMVRHQVLSRLTRYFRVIWMNPPKDWASLWLRPDRGGNQDDAANARFSTLDSGLIVYNPGRWLPEIWRPRFLGRWLRTRRLHNAREKLRRLGCDKIVLYLWKPEQAAALELLPHDVSCYHIFDEYSYSQVEVSVDPDEARLIAAVDQVFISSEAMFRKKGGFNSSSALLPNGVDFPAFSTPAPEPEDLRPIPHPRIGYVGVIKKQIDLGLLARLAKARQSWQFVLVGPVGNVKGSEALLDSLRSLPNVHLLGGKRARDLPGYIQYVDACVACYLVDGYTKFISPLKLHEYLAAGRPVVGSDIEPIRPYAGLVGIARDEGEWLAALEQCLLPESGSGEMIAKRRERVKELDWGLLVERLVVALCNHLDPAMARTLLAKAAPREADHA